MGRGSVGWSVRVELAGSSMQLMIPAASGTPATLQFTLSLEMLEPLAALQLLRAALSSCPTFLIVGSN
ncbi:hypothetical protein [Streptomyces sp. NPDC049915]|uniref:hypothetical protein n=1 Tax=Streptomyces sp. NPDC049915 TaxID=3155510 RepID=UPI003424AA97